MDTFLTASDLVLTQAVDFFEKSWPEADVDLLDGILTVSLPEGQQYIINRHGVTQQIWVASPFTGAHHFQWVEGTWQCTRTQINFSDFLLKECQFYAA